jgi:hypothetical protein
MNKCIAILLYGTDLRRDKRASPRHRAGDGIVEMLEAEGEPLLRAGRVKADTGDLAGREADVIAGEPVVTPLFGRGRQTLVAGGSLMG